MPTGYTHKIKPQGGVTFEQFVLDCARAMGACVTLRDEPGGGEAIPEQFEPSDWHSNSLKEAQETLRDLQTASASEIVNRCGMEHAEAVGRVRLRNMACDEQRQAYEAMLARVRQWKPPTARHEGLRDFMVQQITESINFDCHKQSEPTQPVPKEWLSKQIEECHRLIGYHAAEHAKEVARAADRTEWVRALRRSLGIGGRA